MSNGTESNVSRRVCTREQKRTEALVRGGCRGERARPLIGRIQRQLGLQLFDLALLFGQLLRQLLRLRRGGGFGRHYSGYSVSHHRCE